MSTLTTAELEQLVQQWAALDERRQQIEEQQRHIKTQLATNLGEGASLTIAGLKVTVSAPPRRFNIIKAAEFLTEEQKALATHTTLDPAKVKGFLPPILLDQAMDPGNGNPVVRIS